MNERTKSTSVCSKDPEEEVVWRVFTEFDLPGKSSVPNGICHPHWVKIYDETSGQNNLHAKYTKFFLPQFAVNNKEILSDKICNIKEILRE